MLGKFFICCFCCLLTFVLNTNAQEESISKLQDLVESIVDQLPEGADLTTVIDQIQFIHKNPIPINSCTAEDLNALYFLNALQVQEIIAYVHTYGPLMDLAELQTLPSMNIESLRLLQTLVALESNKDKWKNAFQQVENNILLRYVSNFRKLSPNYLGDAGRVYQRYQMNAASVFQLNLTLDKDHGEYFWNQKNPHRIDFVSGNVVLKPSRIIQNVVLGDYHLQFGQGLVLWTGFTMGMGPDITMIAKKPMGLKPYNSASEFNFMRGAAATFSFFNNRLKWTPFFSKQKLDAVLNVEQKITSMPQSGYHRTRSELNSQQKVSQLNTGMVLEWQLKNFLVGTVAQLLKFGNDFQPSTTLSENKNPLYKQQKNLGIYYQFMFKNLYGYGETVWQNQQQWATVNGLLVSLSKNASLNLLYRNYARFYQAYNAQAIGENSKNANESGFYAGFDFKLSKKISFNLFGDMFNFPWLRHRVDAPSSGYQFFGQSVFKWKKEHQWILRYRMRNKPINNDLNGTLKFNNITEVETQSLRSQINWLYQKWQFENRIEGIRVENNAAINRGLLIYQDVTHKLNRRFSMGLRTAYFNTTAYDSRIYAFENNVLYAFGFNAFQGKGFRNYINLHGKVSKKIDVWCRYAQTFNLNPNLANHELTIQVRGQF